MEGDPVKEARGKTVQKRKAMIILFQKGIKEEVT